MYKTYRLQNTPSGSLSLRDLVVQKGINIKGQSHQRAQRMILDDKWDFFGIQRRDVWRNTLMN